MSTFKIWLTDIHQPLMSAYIATCGHQWLGQPLADVQMWQHTQLLIMTTKTTHIKETKDNFLFID